MTNTQKNEKELQQHESTKQEPMSESYSQSVEDFWLRLENNRGREEDWMKGQSMRPVYDERFRNSEKVFMR